ncbi:hypothetical protein [Actinomadura physcomitrii]|uniref:hypothetical protein n=1 Tax=Actinomadura physcomitrii TaxID=2650748 RepID=UPI001922DB5C|nr:hypothetical protein [Actinomadura physcomitrii]
MPLTVVAECLASPGREDRLRTALEALIEPSLDEHFATPHFRHAEPMTIRRLVPAP